MIDSLHVAECYFPTTKPTGSQSLIIIGLLTVIGAWKSPSATGPLLQWKSPGSNNSVLIRAHIHGNIPYLVWKNPYTGYPWLSIYLNKSRLLTSLTVFSRMDHCRGMLEKVDVFAGKLFFTSISVIF